MTRRTRRSVLRIAPAAALLPACGARDQPAAPATLAPATIEYAYNAGAGARAAARAAAVEKFMAAVPAVKVN